MTDIVVVGSLNMDMIVVTPRLSEPGETLEATSFHTGSGGKGANQAVAASRSLRRHPRHARGGDGSSLDMAPCQVRMIGAVGDDAFGRTLRDNLYSDFVDVSEVQVLPRTSSGTATIIVDEFCGENRILYVPGANHGLKIVKTSGMGIFVAPIYEPRKGEVVLFQLESPQEVVFHYIKKAKEVGAIVVLNPSPVAEIPEDVLECVDHLILNQGEAEVLSGQTVKYDKEYVSYKQATSKFIAMGISHVVLTLGSLGVYTHFYRRGQEKARMHNAYKVKAVDTTGAGDTFTGAYAAKIASSFSGGQAGKSMLFEQWCAKLDNIVDFAQTASSIAVQRPGAQDAMPWLDDILTA